MGKPILSLCFPTNVVRQFFEVGLQAVYSQKDVSLDEFEVVVADNGDDDLAEAFIKERFQYPNLHYYRTKAEGFTNQNECYRLANGVFRKMINTRAVMLPGTLRWMIDVVKKHEKERPILHFMPGCFPYPIEEKLLNTDEFTMVLGHFISSSYPIGIWESDMPALERIDVDFWFPHLALLYDLRSREKLHYIILDYKWSTNQPDTGKGGYDCVYTFSIRFPELIQNLKDRKLISNETYSHVVDSLKEFLKVQYLNEILTKTDHTFTFHNVHKNLSHYFGIRFCINIVADAYDRARKREKIKIYTKVLGLQNLLYQKLVKRKTAVYCVTENDNGKVEFEQYYKSLGFDEVVFYKGLPEAKNYQAFYDANKDKYSWIAFFEIDERLILKSVSSIKELLNNRRFNSFQIIRINNGTLLKDHYTSHIVRGGLHFVQFHNLFVFSKRDLYRCCTVDGKKCKTTEEYLYPLPEIAYIKTID